MRRERMTMTISKSASRQAAKKPSRRDAVKKAKAKRAMPLRTPDPVRKGQMKSRRNSAKPMKRMRPQTGGGEGSTANDPRMPSSGLFTVLLQWSPLGIFLRQQAFLADAMGCKPPVLADTIPLRKRTPKTGFARGALVRAEVR